MPSLITTVEPLIEPVSLFETKDWLRVDHTDDDALIDVLIMSARVETENYLRRTLINKTFEWRLDKWPTAPFCVPEPPLVSVSQIDYIDENGATQTLATTVYDVDPKSDPGRIMLKWEQTFPELRSIENAITITYVAGYGLLPTDTPHPVRTAVMVAVADAYENRESIIVGQGFVKIELDMITKRLLNPYRMWEF